MKIHHFCRGDFLMLRGFLLLLLAATFLPTPVKAGEPITVAYSDFPPLTGEYDGDSKNRPGLLVEMYQQVLSSLGYDVTAVKLPPKRIRTLMEQGKEIDLYVCGEFSQGQRPAYHYGPKFVSLTAILIQLASEPKLESVSELKDRTVLKQRGFGGLVKLLDPSNSFYEAGFTSIVPMLARQRAKHMIDYKERILPRLLEHFSPDDFRLYNLRRYTGSLCLHKRFDRVEERLEKIHDAMIAFQESDKGKELFAAYKYGGKFGVSLESE